MRQLQRVRELQQLRQLQQLRRLIGILSVTPPAWRQFHRASSWSEPLRRLGPPASDITPRPSRGLSFPRFERFDLRPRINGPPPGSRASVRSFSPVPLPMAALESILGAVAPNHMGGHRTYPYPSAGALYGVELFVIARCVSGLPSGIYHFLGGLQHLELMWEWRADAKLSDVFREQPFVDNCSAIVVASARMDLYEDRYGDRGYRFALLEAGAMLQVLDSAAADAALSTCWLGGFFDTILDEVLGSTKSHDYLVNLCGLAVGMAT